MYAESDERSDTGLVERDISAAEVARSTEGRGATQGEILSAAEVAQTYNFRYFQHQPNISTGVQKEKIFFLDFTFSSRLKRKRKLINRDSESDS